MGITNLEEVFVHELKDILDAERQLVKALPKMAKAATNEDLKAAFEEHKSVTEEHVGRLETIFESFAKAARGKKCVGMEGLVKEGSELINDEEPGSPLDAALICAGPEGGTLRDGVVRLTRGVCSTAGHGRCRRTFGKDVGRGERNRCQALEHRSGAQPRGPSRCQVADGTIPSPKQFAYNMGIPRINNGRNKRFV